MEVASEDPVEFKTKSQHCSERKDAHANGLSCCLPASCISQSKDYCNLFNRFTQQNQAGGWKTMPYTIGNDICEKIATIGLFFSLILYLVQEYNLKHITAANVVNIVSGSCSMTPLIGGFLASTYLGRFWTLLVSSILDLMGTILLVLSATLPSLRPPSCSTNDRESSICSSPSLLQLLFLYTAFLFIVLASGGLRSCAYPFGADQFSITTRQEMNTFQSFTNWYFCSIYVAMLLSATIIVYIEQEVSWGWGFGVLSVTMSLAIVIFLMGTPIYKYVPPQRSSLLNLVRVPFAAFRKKGNSLPSDSEELFEFYSDEFNEEKAKRLGHSDQYMFLDKAAIVLDGDLTEDGRIISQWRLCTVHQVEEFKVLLRMVPIWACGLLHAISIAQSMTFVVLQATTMNRQLSSSFTVPAGSMGVFPLVALIVWLPMYDRLVLPLARRLRGQEGGGITFLQRVGIGNFITVLAMLVSGAVEAKRRSVARSSGLVDDPDAVVDMSAFWLVPQMVLTGLAESFYAVGQIEFYYEQLPEGLRSFANALFWCSSGIGTYISSMLMTIVSAATRSRSGHGDWLDENLNRAHLDYFYYLIAGILLLNFFFFLISAHCYKYNGTLALHQPKKSQLRLPLLT